MRAVAVIVFIIFCAAGSCKKEKEDIYWGNVSAQSNGVNWSAKVRAGNSTHFADKFDIIFEKYNNSEILIEVLDFTTIPKSTGRYRIFKKISPFKTRKKQLQIITP